MLCGTCSSIFCEDAIDQWLDVWRRGDPSGGDQDAIDPRLESYYMEREKSEGRRLVDSGGRWRTHHLTATAIHQAAESSCFVCLVILRSYPNLTTGTIYTMNVETSQQEFTVLEIVPAGLSTKKSGVEFDLNPIDDAAPEFALSQLSLSESSTGGQHCLRLAKHWFETCCRGHKRCRDNRSPETYPTRLLALDENYARLIHTEQRPPDGPYATLSHCWGQHPIDVLTPDNLDEFAAGKLIKDLPPSFRDCCMVCQSLGISYAWIDSFCILQGPSPASIEDWKRESLLMENVYANSSINIGASHSSSAKGGCFRARPVSSRTHFLSWRASKLGRTQVYALREMFGDEALRFDDLHLFSRAWVVQERLLSPRMLHFGVDQLWWQCTEDPLMCEKYPGKPQAISVLSSSYVRPAALEEDQSKLQETWDSIVDVYSGCGLTVPHTDKQRAIQGIASRIARLTGDDFVDGVFWRRLPKALCWTALPMVANGRGRARRYRAPSWSWMSMDCRIDHGPSRRRGTSNDDGVEAAAVCILADANGEPETRRTLICVGRLLLLTLPSYQGRPGVPGDFWAAFQFVSVSGTMYCTLDDPDARQCIENSQVVFFPVFRSRDQLQGLVLFETPEGTWCRLGLGRTDFESETFYQNIQATKPRLILLD